MCGHVGVFGKVGIKHEKMFKELLWVDALRGKDSTGVASVTRHNLEQVNIAKQVGGPEELVNDKRYDKCFQGQIGVLMGHNRWKTKGSVNRRNAHPFEFSEIVGAHNGTLHSQYQFEDGNMFDVDSEALFNHMNIHGAYETIKIARGALALAWYNKKYGSMNFYRNLERPLWFALTKDGDAMFYASEVWMLIGIAFRNEVELNEPWELSPFHMISFTLEKGSGKIGKPVITKIEPPKEEPRKQTSTSNWQGNQGSKGGAGTTTNVVSLQKPWTSDEEISHLGKDGEAMVFKVGETKKTAYGSDIVLLENPYLDAPGWNYICYLHAPNVSKIFEEHDYVLADVERVVNLEKFGWCFVVLPSSIEGLCGTDVGDHTELAYPDHKGTLMSKVDFEAKYPYCSYCSTDIDGDKENTFTKDGDILCSDCSKDKDILELVA